MDRRSGAGRTPGGHVRLSRIGAVFAWVGLTSVGGGRYAFFHDALVVRRRWVNNEEFVQDLTLAQVIPGALFSNIAIALGFRLGGWRASVLGGVAVVLPGALVLLALSALYFRGAWSPTAGGAMRAMAAAVVGLVFLATARVIGASLKDWRAVLIAAATFALVGPLHVNMALAILVVAPVSMLLYHRRRSTP